VQNAYRNVDKKIKTQGDRIVVEGESQGIRVRMWVNKNTNTIETAFPVN